MDNKMILTRLKLTNYLRKIGIKTEFHPLGKGLAGRIFYQQHKIVIDPNMSAEQISATLLHEAGHWLSYVNHAWDNPTEKQRERWAIEYGWRINMGLKLGITKKRWRYWHE
jgi:hypothetical protein